MRIAHLAVVATLGLASVDAALAQGQPVPEIRILTWPAARYQSYFETSNYVAEGWRKLGLKVTLDPQPFPNPMITKWFRERDFDVVMSVLSGQPQRMEPDFFTNAQFNTKSGAPGDFNVGGFSNAAVDALGERQLAVYEPEARRKLTHELQKLLYDEQPEAIIATTNYTFAINTANADIPGYEESPDGPRAPWNMLRMTSKRGAAVRIGRTIDQTTFNPLAASTGNDFDNLVMVYDKLIELGPDGAPRMWLADKIEIIDPTHVVVRIRAGHSFSDGKPVTADDVKFSFDYLKKWEAVYFKKYLERVESVAVVDPLTVRFTLTQPFAPFVMNTLGQVVILPRHVWADIVERTGIAKPQDARNNPLVGSGAYTLRHWREGQEISLQRRAEHFMKPQADLLIIVFGSAEIVGAALKKGDIDVSFQPIVPTVVKEFGAERNMRLLRARSVGYMSMRYNMTRPVLANRALRHALAHAIPYEAIIDEVLGGDGDRSASPIVPANAYWHNSELPLFKHDVERGRAILRQAGFTWGPDGALRYPAR